MRTRLEHHDDRRPPAAAPAPRRGLSQLARTLAALACGAFAAAPAFAVAVSVTVTNADGEPVASAEIDLGFGAKGTTDGSGRATIDVPEERVGEENVLVGITFVVNETTGETRTIQRSVNKLGLNLDFRLTPQEQQPDRQPDQRPERPSPTNGVPPGRELGCAFAGAGFQVAFGAGIAEVDETPLEEQSFEFVFFIDGSQVTSASGPKSDAELAEINRVEKKKHERDELGPVSVRIPLYRGSCRDPGLRIVPALRLGAGQADVDFTSTNVEMPGFSQSFSGDGWMYGGGLDLTLLRAEKRCVYGLGLEHWRSESIDVRRSVDLATTFFGSGTMTLRDDIRYEYETTSVRLTAGHAGDRFLPYAGLRYTWFDAELDQRSAIDISALFPTAPPGTEVVQDQHILGFFGDDYVEAVAGIMAKIGERAAVAGEAVAGEDSLEFKVNALLTF
jgi:hypothetical protein